MSGLLLDTNVTSETIRPLPDAQVMSWLESQAQESQFLSVMTLGELRRGITLLAPGTRRSQLEYFVNITLATLFAGRVLAITQPIAELWGVLDGKRKAAGRPLGVADGLIAATALERGLTLVTRNVRDFAGLGGNAGTPYLLTLRIFAVSLGMLSPYFPEPEPEPVLSRTRPQTRKGCELAPP